MLSAKRVIGFKQESVPGVIETLNNTTVTTRTMGEVDALTIVRNKIQLPASGTFGYRQSALGDITTALKFQTYGHGKNASGGLPGWATPLLECVGMPFSSTTATTGVVANDTISAAHWIDGRKYVARGMGGNLTITMERGRPWLFNWDLIGAFSADPSAEAIPTGTYETVIPPTWDGTGSCTIDSDTAFEVERIELNLGNQYEMIPNPNFDGGYSYCLIRNRFPTVTITPHARTDYDWHAKHTACTEIDMTLVASGGALNTLTLAVNDMELSETPTPADVSGAFADALTFDVHGAISIAFT